jgi:hypothetical protein
MVAEHSNPPEAKRPGIRVGVRVQVVYAGATREPTFTATIRQVTADFIRIDLYGLPTRRLPPQPGDPVILVVQEGDELSAFDARAIGIEPAPPTLLLTPPVETRRMARQELAPHEDAPDATD